MMLALALALSITAQNAPAHPQLPPMPVPTNAPHAPQHKKPQPEHGSDARMPELPPLATAPKLFERAEPNLAEGARMVRKGDVDSAIERFHKADPQDPDERAIVEFDVGAAQLFKAEASKQPVSPGAQAKADKDGGPKIDKEALDAAKASFERAYGLARDPRIKSEAALAAGNASANGSDADDAIAQYRKAIVADPKNERAKTNLRRVLDAKRAQPPKPPQNNDDKKNDDKKNDDKKNDDKKNDDKKNDDKKNDDKKN
ncbi:MAG TPA: hypothetical protein VGO62_04805, partial [Myxococcota bacterium]